MSKRRQLLANADGQAGTLGWCVRQKQCGERPCTTKRCTRGPVPLGSRHQFASPHEAPAAGLPQCSLVVIPTGYTQTGTAAACSNPHPVH